jgi:aminoglycoside phosphotransferase (APT) family kinase protein
VALESPLVPPDQQTVAAALDEQVTAVRPTSDASNTDLTDVVRTAGGDLAVLKAQRRSTRASFLAEPAVVRAVADATDVPVPAVLAVAADGGPLGRPYVLTSSVSGRSPRGGEGVAVETLDRVVSVAGRQLGALHRSDAARLSYDTFGRVRYEDGRLVEVEGADDWPSLFVRWSRGVTQRLASTRFADLGSRLRDHFRTFPDCPGVDRETATLAHADYRFENLRVDPDGEPPVRAVLDWADPPAVHGEFCLAHAEEYLVDRLVADPGRRHRLRTAYADRRGRTLDAAFEERYAHYRLFARVCTMVVFDGWAAYAPDDPESAERRCRATVGDLLAE